MPLDKADVCAGQRVMDPAGNAGTVRWVGRIEKDESPPHKDYGVHMAVEYDYHFGLAATAPEAGYAAAAAFPSAHTSTAGGGGDGGGGGQRAGGVGAASPGPASGLPTPTDSASHASPMYPQAPGLPPGASRQASPAAGPQPVSASTAADMSGIDIATTAAAPPVAGVLAPRTDGVNALNGRRYCAAPPGAVELVKPKAMDRAAAAADAVAALRRAFGARVASVPDAQLLKFALARRFDAKAAEKMVGEHIKWAAAWRPSADECFSKSMPQVERYWPFGLCAGLAKDGSVISIERVGNGGAIDFRGFLEKYDLDGVARYHVAIGETVKRRIVMENDREVAARAAAGLPAEPSPRVRRVLAIYDLDQLALGGADKTAISFAKALVGVDQGNFPEHLGRAFIINAPSFFASMFRLVRFFLDSRTRDKYFVLARGEDVRAALAPYIDPAAVPDVAGGPDASWRAAGGVVGAPAAPAAPAVGGGEPLQCGAAAPPSRQATPPPQQVVATANV